MLNKVKKHHFIQEDPYAAAKLYAHWITINYREAYNIFACNGILFNHESPRRGETFVSRKITRALTRIKLGVQSCLYLGNLESKRDWGHARDYVEMQWLMLQQKKAEDYVISTGKQYSVRQFVDKVLKELKMPMTWEGEGINERGYIINEKGEKKIIIKIDKKYFRPAEVENLLGDSTKAEKKLGWKPKISFDELVKEMVKEDLEIAKKEKLLIKNVI